MHFGWPQASQLSGNACLLACSPFCVHGNWLTAGVTFNLQNKGDEIDYVTTAGSTMALGENFLTTILN